jgi:hypothetical protein
MRANKTLLFYSFLLVIIVLPASLSEAQSSPDLGRDFTKREALIPMRDGVRLYTEIYVPTDTSTPRTSCCPWRSSGRPATEFDTEGGGRLRFGILHLHVLYSPLVMG